LELEALVLIYFTEYLLPREEELRAHMALVTRSEEPRARMEWALAKV